MRYGTCYTSGMAKEAKIAKSFRLQGETLKIIRYWARTLKVGDADVVEQAVTLFDSVSTGGPDVPPQVVFEQSVVRDDLPPSRSDLQALISGMQGRETDAGSLPKNARRLHCGKQFAGQRYATICPGCKDGGHFGDVRDCRTCQERDGGAL